MTRIFHIASAADWSAAQLAGRYTTSTRGRTLAEEGFVHACRGDQWQGVRERFYSDATEPLVLLVIETERLDVPVVEEAVLDSAETFPHVYGAIPAAAVLRAIPLDRAGTPTTPAPPDATSPPLSPISPAAATDTNATNTPNPSFSRIFLREVLHQLLLGSVVIGLGFLGLLAGLAVGSAVDSDWPPLLGALVGLALGAAIAVRLRRARLLRETTLSATGATAGPTAPSRSTSPPGR